MTETPDQRNSDAVRIGVTIVDQLIRAGVREAVVCPGSRNSALALALAEADRTHRLRLHVRTDERTAAFLALGLAKASRMVVPVVMTSGTAVANCLPAMVEASMSGVPLMVLSADRPLAMVGTGANQTIDQAQIFGVHSKATFNTELLLARAAKDGSAHSDAVQASAAHGQRSAATAGESDSPQSDFAVLRAVISEAVEAALNPVNPGGVHVDVPLVDPLVPTDTDTLSLLAQEVAGEAVADEVAAKEAAGDGAAAAQAGQPTVTEVQPAVRAGQPAANGTQHKGPRPLPFGEVTVDLSKRTLAIAGSSADEAWARSIRDELADVPTIAEPTAAKPDFPVHSAAIGMFAAGLVSQGEYSAMTRPEQIILVGRPTLHRAVTKLLADPDIQVTVLTDVENYPRLGPLDLSAQATTQGSDRASNVDTTGSINKPEAAADGAAQAGRPGTANIAQVGSRIRLVGDSPNDWLQVCQGVSDMGVDAVRQSLELKDKDATVEVADSATSSSEPVEPPAKFSAVHAVAMVADSLSDGDLLILGASSTIRDASRAGLPFDGVRTLANRGAAGIDGTISTAIGAAMAHSAADPTSMRAPRTLAVMGDLTFLHDATALNIGPLEPKPSNLLIVVINDNGGGIFETLEPGRDSLRTFGDGTAAFERVFGTPTDANIEAICAAFHTEYQQVTTVEALAEAIENHEEAGSDGIVVVEAVVDRAWRRTIEKHIQTTVNPQR